jgi:hypothetical protein
MHEGILTILVGNPITGLSTEIIALIENEI